jgi:methylglutaconyl-CoA hydratase
MSYEFLKLQVDSRGVAFVTLNRPEIHNAFNDKLIAELTQAFEQLDADPNVRLLVLSGEGRSFCAGADLNWMKSMVNYSMEENIEDSRKLAKMFQTMNYFSKPVIGKINGHALGGGVGVVSICDYAITHEKAKFGFTEVRLGLVPAVISPFCINKIGESNARAWFLSGEMFKGDKAKEMGLVHEVTTLEDFETRVNEVIESHLKAGPEAAMAAKLLINDVLATDEEDLETYTCTEIAKKRISAEGQEGMKALLNKEQPSWMKQ